MTKQSKDDAIIKVVLEYFYQQNRPYSIVDIFNNLHKEYGKTAINKAVLDLVEEKKLIEKTYGKQKVYVINQASMETVSNDEINEMDKNIANLQNELKTLQSFCGSVESEIKVLGNTLSTEDAIKTSDELTEECAKLEENLKKVKEVAKNVSPKERDEVYLNLKKYVGHWRKRKRMGSEMINCILEGYPKSKKQFYEEVGIETDEDYNVTFPDLTKFNIKT
ncbi:homologous-pairing protein 2-like protein [Trichoplax sp. H2]|uniref:Homologous-pairing protein 2 homolog n=1 Tax=Trichoplax adhaerens TaxID=10228 RepID=B3RQF1_TRIAD|nr:hypothetical protein TRIADDRAFT_54965 [Trichoplax adhaerens]EDV27229.1 hypothetical protein TRIADDRAFT_54965 [Trichoplax adhaerens]RDD42682.1 homologous-pairing protein 2-like protein [Trichoplax sp. H2]|eukprot:XP_002111225.1 hypothetical protein TRIADDRAFT_54965 [Trichoplax adhaerens]